MILQHIIFPKKGICEEKELYVHTLAGESHQDADNLIVAAGGEVDFFTYFNSFSVEKWKLYTRVPKVQFTLSFQGDCEISLWEAAMMEGRMQTTCLDRRKVSATEKTACSLVFSCQEAKGIVYAAVKAAGETLISGGTYETVGEIPLYPVNLEIGICTFRREEFVKKTLDTIRSYVIENSSSPMQGHLHVYVSDNGRTLPVERLSGPYIHVMPNNNAGGAGGFGRCMLEAVRDREQYGLTHLLLMDDDIVLEPETLFRTYALLCTLKPERKEDMLGGGLLRLDIPYIQHANGERWQGGRIGFTKRGYDLRSSADVLRNEEDLPMEYNGWWYSVIPLREGFRGFPLPVFIHGDDIEYGLRFDGRIMTLNGIGVWHDAFDNRKASSMEYYDMRNTLIACAVHHPEFSCLHMVKSVCRHLVGQMLHYREEDQRLTMKGVEDFCKGTSFLKETDPSAYHAEIMKMGYVLADVSDDLERMGVDREAAKPAPGRLYEETGFSKKHLLSVNGWLLPGRKQTLALPMGAHPDALYRCQRALLYDPDTAKGFYVERRRKNLFVTFGRCVKMWWLLATRYKKAVRDFQEHGKELVSREFWENYVG